MGQDVKGGSDRAATRKGTHEEKRDGGGIEERLQGSQEGELKTSLSQLGIIKKGL